MILKIKKKVLIIYKKLHDFSKLHKIIYINNLHM